MLKKLQAISLVIILLFSSNASAMDDAMHSKDDASEEKLVRQFTFWADDIPLKINKPNGWCTLDKSKTVQKLLHDIHRETVELDKNQLIMLFTNCDDIANLGAHPVPLRKAIHIVWRNPEIGPVTNLSRQEFLAQQAYDFPKFLKKSFEDYKQFDAAEQKITFVDDINYLKRLKIETEQALPEQADLNSNSASMYFDINWLNAGTKLTTKNIMSTTSINRVPIYITYSALDPKPNSDLDRDYHNPTRAEMEELVNSMITSLSYLNE